MTGFLRAHANYLDAAEKYITGMRDSGWKWDLRRCEEEWTSVEAAQREAKIRASDVRFVDGDDARLTKVEKLTADIAFAPPGGFGRRPDEHEAHLTEVLRIVADRRAILRELEQSLHVRRSA